jgi:RNA polymerase sigma-70 factor, ECF subfamily
MEKGERLERANEVWSRLKACMPALRAFVRRMARSDELARDVVQETCLRILRAGELPEEDSKFAAWCRGVARNVLIAEWRKNTSKARVSLDEDVHEVLDVRSDPEACLRASEELAHASARLDAEGAELLVRRYLFGERIVDLADELDQNPTAVRMRLLRLRSSVRAQLRR